MIYFIKGGLGNQIFQFAHAIESNHSRITFNTSLLSKYAMPRNFELAFYFDLVKNKRINVTDQEYTRSGWLEKSASMFNGVPIIPYRCGYFQDITISDNILHKLRQAYLFSDVVEYRGSDLLIHLRLRDFERGDYVSMLGDAIRRINFSTYQNIFYSTDSSVLPEGLRFIESEAQKTDIDFSKPRYFRAIFSPCSTFSLWYGLILGSEVLHPVQLRQHAPWESELVSFI